MFQITIDASTRLVIFLCLYDSKPSERKRKRDDEESNLPDGSGFGDHIQLLQIFECWDSNNYDIRWCKDNGLQVDYSIFFVINFQISTLKEWWLFSITSVSGI